MAAEEAALVLAVVLPSLVAVSCDSDVLWHWTSAARNLPSLSPLH